MGLTRFLLPVVVTGFLALPAGALAAGSCAGELRADFNCTTLAVPLDREGVRNGTLRLSVALEKPRRGNKEWVLALSGGPGQSSVSAAQYVAETHRALLAHARLVVFDQRGTGARALRCPALQRLDSTDPVPTAAISECAARLGPSRADYTTTDSVEDIEALRRQLGARRLTITGVSYGTYVAVQYARRYPQRVTRLVLDSPVGPDGIDSFQLDTLAALPRVLRDWCRGRPCPASARDPWADLVAVAGRLARGPMRARVPDRRGRKRSVALPNQSALWRTLLASDINPALQALLPSALAAASEGDAGPLLRLQRAVAGPRLQTGDLSVALNLATVCSDVLLPYRPDDDVETRSAAIGASLASVAPANFTPFTADTVRSESIGTYCLPWPATRGQALAETAPFPDVPTLILSGGFDQRTPIEGARSLAARLPRAQLVVVPGTGHDTIDTDLTGCVSRALERFANGRTVGSPCRAADNRVQTAAPLSDSVATSPRPAGKFDRRDARVLGAIVATVQDARLQALAQLYAGFASVSGGGRLGGRFAGDDELKLDRYEAVPGVRIDGVDVEGAVLSVRLPTGRVLLIEVGAIACAGR